MITITPLGQKTASNVASQASTSSSAAPPPRALSYLVQIDSAYLLLDCGAPEDLRFPASSPSATTEHDAAEYTLPDGSLDAAALSSLPLDEALGVAAPRIQLVLLSHSTMHNVGLYAYARARLGLTCPAYATLPTASMARLVTLEASLTLASECDVAALEKRPTKAQREASAKAKRDLEESKVVKKEEDEDREDEQRDRCIPTRAEIDEAFESIRTLRYLQPTVLDGSGLSSLSLTAHSAGHTLGGTVWKLRSPTSGTVVLAIDWNHVRERHIDGSGVIEGASAVAGGAGALPTASRAGEEAAGTKRAEMLVTSGARLAKQNARRKDKDKSLLDLIHHTLTVSKSTLHLPLDASPRLLEVLLLLDRHWAYAYPNARFPLCLVSRTGKEVIERARTMREWMGKSLQGEEGNAGGADKGRGRRGEVEQHGPLELRFLRIFTSLSALSAAVPREAAKVVITVGPSLLYGPSLRFFREHVAGSRENTLVLTTEREMERGSPSSELKAWWLSGQDGGWTEREVGKPVEGKGRGLSGVEVRERRALEGQELEAFREREREEKEREERKKAMLKRSRKRLEADEEDEDDDEGEEDDEDSSDDDDEDDDEMGGGGLKRKRAGMMDSEAGGTSSLKKRKSTAAADAGSGGKDGDAAGEDTDLLLSHDVYLRGSAARTAANFFNAGQQQQRMQKGPSSSKITAEQRLREARDRHSVGARFRSFPVIERRRRIDAFGEVIDVSRWLSRGRKEEEERQRLEAGAGAQQLGASGTPMVATSTSRNAAALAEQREQEEDELQGAPSKFVHLSNVKVEVHCRIHFLDLDGLIDGRALSIVLPQLAPRRLVLVDTPQPQPTSALVHHGGEDEGALTWWSNPKGGETPTTRFVASLLSLRDFTRDVFAPPLGGTVRVGGQVQSFDVRLGEGVLEGVEMGTYEEWALGWVEGVVKGKQGDEEKESGVVILERRAVEELSAEDQEDDEAVAAAAAEVTAGPNASHPDRLAYTPHAARPATTLFIGSVRLSTLKTLLSTGSARIPAEFGGSGTLVCGTAALASVQGNAATTAGQASAACTVEKSGERITVEGNAGRTFVRVRDAVYKLHARVGGGIGQV